MSTWKPLHDHYADALRVTFYQNLGANLRMAIPMLAFFTLAAITSASAYHTYHSNFSGWEEGITTFAGYFGGIALWAIPTCVALCLYLYIESNRAFLRKELRKAIFMALPDEFFTGGKNSIEGWHDHRAVLEAIDCVCNSCLPLPAPEHFARKVEQLTEDSAIKYAVAKALGKPPLHAVSDGGGFGGEG